MKQLRFVTVVSALSAGTGIYVGVKYERHKKIQCKESGPASINPDRDELKISGTKYYIPLPTVSAAAPVKLDPPVLSGTVTPYPSPPSNRISEIMKFGFPSLDQIRSYDNFILSYDRRNRTAHWVFEHIKPEHVNKDNDTDRENCNFKEDTSIHPYFRATNSDYKSSGYDRGHLAAAANHRHCQKALDQTFYFTNISPQVGKGFNRDAWNNLEKFVRGIARKNRNVYVCTGPLYLPRREADGKLYVKYEVIGRNNVAVPTHFFKVVVIENYRGEFELLSFIMPNQVIPENVPIKNFLVPMEAIERAGGFLLFDKIPRSKFHSINGKSV